MAKSFEKVNTTNELASGKGAVGTGIAGSGCQVRFRRKLRNVEPTPGGLHPAMEWRASVGDLGHAGRSGTHAPNALPADERNLGPKRKTER